MRDRLRYVVAIPSLVLLLAWPVCGQGRGPEPEVDPATVAARESARVRSLREDLSAARKALEGSDELRKSGRRRLESMSVDDIAVVVSDSLPLSAKLKARLDAATRRKEAVAGRGELLESLLKIQASRGKQLRDALETLRALAASSVRLTTALNALGADKSEEILKSLGETGLESLAGRQAELTALERELSEELAGLDPARRKLEEEQARLAALAESAEAQLKALSRRYRRALRREELLADLGKRPPRDVAALLISKQVEAERRVGEVMTLSEKARRELAELNRLRDEFRERRPPDPGTIKGRATNPRLREAQRALAVNEALTEYQQLRRAGSEQRLKHLKSLDEAVAALADPIEPARTTLLELDVAVALVNSHVNAGRLEPVKDARAKPAQISQMQSRMREIDAFVTGLQTAVPQRTKDAAEALEQATKELARLTAERPNLEADVAREKRWDAFIGEASSLSGERLVELLNQSLEARRKARAALIGPKETVAAVERRLVAARRRLAEIEDPRVRMQKEREAEQRRKILNRLRRLAGLAEVAPKAEGDKSPAADAAKTAGREDDPRLAELVEVQVHIDARLRSYREQEEALAALKAAELAEVEALKSLADASAGLLEAARRAYGCAEEIQFRVGRGELGKEILTEAAQEASRRDNLLALESELAELRRRISSESELDTELEHEVERVARESRFLTARQGLISEKIKLYRERARILEESRKPREKLSDYEKNAIEDAALELFESGEGWRDVVLSLAGSERARDLERRLKDLYRDVAEQRRRVVLLEKAQDRTREIMARIQRERGLYEAFLPELEAEVERLAREERALEAQVTAALDVSRSDEILAEARKALGRPIKALPRAGADDVSRLAERLFDRFAEHQAWQQWLADITEASSRTGHNRLVSRFDSDLSEIEARKREISDELARLLGPGQTITPVKPADPTRSRAGETGIIRDKRRHAQWSSLRNSVLAIILIPLFAWTVIVVSRRGANRLIERLQPEVALDISARDRERRMQTLVSVFIAAWKTVIIVVAIIYLLRQFGIDVTPIVASAGVVGLAVVFGAQSLVKDFFSGFFVLLENQYKIGDYVQAGAVHGTVEDISLRLTVLRDPDGNLHFVPNGTLETVTNFTHGWSGLNVFVTVSYRSNIDHVLAVLDKVGNDFFEDPDWKGNHHEPPIIRGVDGFLDHGLNIRLVVRTKPGLQWATAREYRKRIKEAFDREGIEIPLPQRVVITAPARGPGAGPPEHAPEAGTTGPLPGLLQPPEAPAAPTPAANPMAPTAGPGTAPTISPTTAPIQPPRPAPSPPAPERAPPRSNAPTGGVPVLGPEEDDE